MKQEELIDAAKDVIGKGEKDDYVIAPTRHADLLAEKASALASVLRRSEVSTVAGQFERKDREAGEAQLVFKKAAQRANWAVLLTACLSASILMIGSLRMFSADGPYWPLILLGLCSILPGALGSMWLFKIREGSLLEIWMTTRAAAETLRLRYFELVTDIENSGEESSLPLPLLQLEYFRRYEFDVQQTYYRKRRADHKRAADKMLTLGAIAVLLASCTTGIAGMLGGLFDTQLASVAGLGVIATALSAFASNNEATAQDRRNMERYGRTLDALEGLGGKLDAVRNAAAEGARDPLKQFVAAVHEQLSLEHRQWLKAADSTRNSLRRLEKSIEGLRPKSANPGTS